MKKRFYILLITLMFCVGGLLGVQRLTPTVETAAWGLHFDSHSPVPKGPASAQTLKNFDAAYVGSQERKVLYLTFDAGYENGCTPKILEVLKKHRVKATFFLVGDYLLRNADLVRQMVEEGHVVGNHTMHHRDMSRLEDAEAFQKELTDLETLFTEITGKSLPKFYRPPQGVYSEKNLRLAQSLGYRTVFWSLAYVDWLQDAQPDPQKALQTLQSRTHNGAVVLLHATSTTNAAILDSLLTHWSNEGYVFETVDGLFC